MKKFLGVLLLLGACDKQEFKGETAVKVQKAQGENVLENVSSSHLQNIAEPQVYGKDADGKDIIGLDPVFKRPIIGTDAEGKAILGKGGFNQDGSPLIGKTSEGKVIIGYNDKNEAIIDILDSISNKTIDGIQGGAQVIIDVSSIIDENGHKIYGKDADGNSVIGWDSGIGKPIIGQKEDGSFIYGKGGVDENKNPIIGKDEDGKIIMGYTLDGKSIVDIKIESTGQTLNGIDSHGVVVVGNSNSGSSSSDLLVGKSNASSSSIGEASHVNSSSIGEASHVNSSSIGVISNGGVVTVDMIQKSCSPGKIKNKKEVVVFPPLRTCQKTGRDPYNEGANPFKWNEINIQNYAVNMPSFSIVCGIEFTFPEQPFSYGDQIILGYNNRVLMASALTSNYPTQRVSGPFPAFDRSFLQGLPMKVTSSLGGPGFCAGLSEGNAFCHFPQTVTVAQGSTYFKYAPNNILNNYFGASLQVSQNLTFQLITGSHLSNHSCHSGLTFDVSINYVE